MVQITDCPGIEERAKGFCWRCGKELPKRRRHIPEFLPLLEKGTAPRTPQDHNQATYRRKRGFRDGEIIWPSTTMQIYNLIRALALPYAGAHGYCGDSTIKVWRCALPVKSMAPMAQALEPGTVIAADAEGFEVRTIDGFITISAYEIEGEQQIAAGLHLGASCT